MGREGDRDPITHELGVSSEDREWDDPFDREPFRRDTAWHYTGHWESRVLIDPAWIMLGDPQSSFTRLNQLVMYARKATTPTKIELLYPKYLEPPKSRPRVSAFFRGQFFREVSKPGEQTPSTVIEVLRDVRNQYQKLAADYGQDPLPQRWEPELDRLIYGALLFGRPDGLELLTLVADQRCDYLLTENPWLADVAEPLRKNGIWVANPEELLELIQLSLRSAGVFIEVVTPFTDEDWGELGRLKVGIEGLGFSSFYHLENRVLHAYQRWFGRIVALHPQNQRLASHGRAAFYHRFPFMLYAHDQLRYHALYAQRFSPKNRYRGDHRFFVAYHLNTFYIMLAALLDNVAWIWNHALGCGFKENDKSRNSCVLTHREFKKRVKLHRPDFVSLLEDDEFATWLKNLTLKRHPAVHREPLFLTEIIEESTGRILLDSASVVEEADKVLVFDLLGAADNDLKMLHKFLTRMEKLPIPAPHD